MTAGQIDILRDAYGIPHCYAGSEHDAFFAQGYVHASDRLWQMEYDRRRAVGRWAEVAGERGLASDLFHRRVDLAGATRRDLEALQPAAIAMLDAFAAGVNARIAEGGFGREFTIAGVEPEPWQPGHSLLVFRVRHLLMGSARHKLWRSVVREVLGDDAAQSMARGFGDDTIVCVPPGAIAAGDGAAAPGDGDGGSNNWAVAGSRTASGLPLVAGDPHRELEAPNVYVQGHIACPEWDVLGIGMPGVPGFTHFGHNDRVAWSITHAMADDQDLYEIDVSRLEPDRVETIAVRGSDPVEVQIFTSRHGAVIGDGLAMAWTATAEPNAGFDAIAPMLRATSVDELFEMMRGWVEPANSLVAADVDGHIGYLTRGRIPNRRRLDAVLLPVPGDDPDHEWTDWVDFEQLPRVVDPECGFVFSANNTIAAPPAPYIGLDVAPPWRATRIVHALRSLTDATVADMEALQRDVVSLAARRVAARVAWAPLEGWDGTMATTSTAAAAYAVLRRELMHVVFDRSGLGEARHRPRNRLLPGIVPEGDLWRVVEPHLHANDVSLLAGATWDEVIAEAVERAEQAWDGEAWGDLHQVAQRHALADSSLDPVSVAIDGDHDTVKVGGYTPTEGFRSRSGSVARYVWNVGDWDASAWVVPLGAGGDVAGEHGTDQRGAWLEGRLLPAPYTRAAVEAVTRSRVAVSTR